jgi:hypothetical protein
VRNFTVTTKFAIQNIPGIRQMKSAAITRFDTFPVRTVDGIEPALEDKSNDARGAESQPSIRIIMAMRFMNFGGGNA